MRRIGKWIYRRPPRYEETYSENLLAIYDASIRSDETAIKNRIEELRPAEKTSEIAFELELLNLRIAEASCLPQIVLQFRRRWGLLSGEAVEQDCPSSADPAALRAEGSLLLANIHRFYSLQQLFYAQKRWILFWMFFWFVVATAIVGIWVTHKEVKFAVLLLLLVGTIGGYTSSLIRIYQLEAGKDLVTSIQTLRSGIIGLIVKPLLGGIFAIVLHVLFLSTLLGGGMFPSIGLHAAKDQPMLFSEFFFGTIQGNPADFAKLLVWCFIAGFAERFVPDKLNALADNAKTEPAAR